MSLIFGSIENIVVRSLPRELLFSAHLRRFLASLAESSIVYVVDIG